LAGIPQIASFTEQNLLHIRVLDKPTPLARAVDVDATNRNWSDRQELSARAGKVGPVRA
jgi:hypothetical protein